MPVPPGNSQAKHDINVHTYIGLFVPSIWYSEVLLLQMWLSAPFGYHGYPPLIGPVFNCHLQRHCWCTHVESLGILNPSSALWLHILFSTRSLEWYAAKQAHLKTSCTTQARVASQFNWLWNALLLSLGIKMQRKNKAVCLAPLLPQVSISLWARACLPEATLTWNSSRADTLAKKP